MGKKGKGNGQGGGEHKSKRKEDRAFDFSKCNTRYDAPACYARPHPAHPRAARKRAASSLTGAAAAGKSRCRSRMWAGTTRDLPRRYLCCRRMPVPVADDRPRSLAAHVILLFGPCIRESGQCLLVVGGTRSRCFCGLAPSRLPFPQDDTEDTIEGHLFAALKKTCLIQVCPLCSAATCWRCFSF
jgi:hypothetical protein